MAVLRSKRQIAKTEFENTFANLYQFTMSQTVAVPKRRRKWLCKELNKIMNLLYREIVEINDYYHPERSKRIEHVDQTIESAISHLYALEKPLMVMWNVQRYKTDKIARWAELINREIFLLNKIHKCDERTDSVMILDWRAIDAAEFLKNMSELHRYTHSKVANAML